MPQFRHRFIVEAPLQAVADFHHSSRALVSLTPPPVIAQMHRVEPLAEGSRAEFTLWLGPLPVRWVAIHENVEMPRTFTDRQVYGPFLSWVHQHTFHALSAVRTEVIDEIQAEFAPRGLMSLVGRLMWLNLRMLFAYRGWATRRLVAAAQPGAPIDYQSQA